MKRLLSIFLSFALLVGCVPLLAACENHLVYYHYKFDLSRGEFVRDGEKITMAEEGGSFTLAKAEYTKKISYGGSEIMAVADEETSYYMSQYFIAASSSMIGRATRNSEGQVSGKGVIGDTSVIFNDGQITLHDAILGYYECDNNYITITYNGTVSQYLIMPISSDSSKKDVGFFSDFYANVKVLAEKVEYTGLRVSTEVLTNGENGQIIANTYTPSRKIEKKTFAVVDGGGFNIEIDEEGNYTLQLLSNMIKENATIEVSIDGLTARVKVKPVVVYFDKSKMTERQVGDTISINESMYYELYNVDFEELKIENLITYGGDCAEIVDGKLICKDKGIVIIRMKATFTYNDKEYTCIDEASFNITEDIIEEQAPVNEKKS